MEKKQLEIIKASNGTSSNDDSLNRIADILENDSAPEDEKGGVK